MANRQLQREALLQSSAFDAAYYVRRYPSARHSSFEPVDHYLNAGAYLGFDPHPLFHSLFYSQRHPESTVAEMNPLYHYLTEGAAKQWQPHPLFDPVFYQRTYEVGKKTPLEHYIEAGPRSGLAPHLLFDADYYLKGLPDVRDYGTLLSRYLECWPKDHRSPHPLFDLEYYLELYGDPANSGFDPLSHYLAIGAAAGNNPHPLFDGAFYYRVNPDVKQAGLNGLLHYLECGGFEGRDPHRWFDSSYYNERNPEVFKARINPLLHYVRGGAFENRAPHPLFRDDHWQATHPVRGELALVEFVSELEQQPERSPLAVLRFRNPPPRVSEEGQLAPAGLNMIGWPRLEIGMGECLREMARAIAPFLTNLGIRDVSMIPRAAPGDDSVASRILPDCRYRANLFVVNADNMRVTCEQVGFEAVRDRFNIAMWAWELADFPDVWRQEMSVVDEFWAFSTFNQQCVATKAEVPVLYMPMPVTLAASAGLRREDFGIPEGRFVFLTQFDFTGFIDRKNPYAAIAAFRKAFPGSGYSAPVLVIKTNNSERYPERMRELMEAVGDDEQVIVLNGTFRRDKVISLMEACDAFVSLHRSEGFGRSMAEAMLMSKPVIATNYSGNAEFTRPDNSCPVNYNLIPVKEGQYPHAAGQVWADADVEHAAWYMRRLTTHMEFTNSIASKAQQTIARDYDPATLGMRYVQRLRLLGLLNP